MSRKRNPRKDLARKRTALVNVRRKLPDVRRNPSHRFIDNLFSGWSWWRRLRGGRWERRGAFVGVPFSHWVRVDLPTWTRVTRREDYRR